MFTTDGNFNFKMYHKKKHFIDKNRKIKIFKKIIFENNDLLIVYYKKQHYFLDLIQKCIKIK